MAYGVSLYRYISTLTSYASGCDSRGLAQPARQQPALDLIRALLLSCRLSVRTVNNNDLRMIQDSQTRPETVVNSWTNPSGTIEVPIHSSAINGYTCFVQLNNW